MCHVLPTEHGIENLRSQSPKPGKIVNLKPTEQEFSLIEENHPYEIAALVLSSTCVGCEKHGGFFNHTETLSKFTPKQAWDPVMARLGNVPATSIKVRRGSTPNP
ncbi:hypothetical protein TNCT_160691 [Trichonephila clavata]|uniref:Uncharacterized protein n=1 Tax=Trichonephila clavata TaxID=2740835 RepID=A0A8X6L236_TRICU|nr:hypothetical protein TNCT_160691 [Trichonephila clavata]